MYPIYINQVIEMPENYTQGDLREGVLKYADHYLNQGSSTPVITESETHPEIVD